MRRSRAAADWGSTNLRFLQTSAFENRHLTSSFEWLKSIGLVPQDVTRMDIRQVITELDPDSIPVSYLAASAHEWDTWGESSPVDFIRALGYETRGAKRDLIVETLMALGREAGASAVAA